MSDQQEGGPEAGNEPSDAQSLPVMESTILFQGTSEIVIRHAGREYRLRKTRLDKLILTA